MTTLNKIADNIAFAFGEQFNHTFKESIKDSIVEYRALLIRQDLDRNPLSNTDYIQSFCIELEEINKSECPQIKVKDYLLKSKEPIPKPLRIKNNGRSNFKYVGAVDRSISLTFATSNELKFLEYLPFQDNVIYYTIRNNYLYVLNNIRHCKLVIDEIIADPRDIKDCDYPELFKDDVPFYIPEDMLTTIKNLIKKDYPQYIKDGQEINKDKDDRP